MCLYQWKQEHRVCAKVIVIKNYAKIYLLDILGKQICTNFSDVFAVYFLSNLRVLKEILT